MMKNDLTDTEEALIEDTVFLRDLGKTCATRKKEYEVVVKTRSEELLALADTIKILNDDDALELFKKTLPSASLLQLKTNGKAIKQRALVALQQANQGEKQDVRINLISLALKGKKVSFEKVVKMIDDMVALLGKEQQDDDSKKSYCEASIDK